MFVLYCLKINYYSCGKWAWYTSQQNEKHIHLGLSLEEAMLSPKSFANTSFPIPTKLNPCPSFPVISKGDDGHVFLPPSSSSVPHLSFSKPSWVVRTESNVRKWVRKKPNPPCVICDGSGKVCCKHCNGKGRTNYTHLMRLPSGKWPKWCKTCGGSGLCYCDRCLGTGEYRDVIGFHFLKETNTTRDSERRAIRIHEDEHLGAADFLLSEPINPQDDSS